MQPRVPSVVCTMRLQWTVVVTTPRCLLVMYFRRVTLAMTILLPGIIDERLRLRAIIAIILLPLL